LTIKLNKNSILFIFLVAAGVLSYISCRSVLGPEGVYPASDPDNEVGWVLREDMSDEFEEDWNAPHLTWTRIFVILRGLKRSGNNGA